MSLRVEQHRPGEQPVFAYDFGDPGAYLMAERVVHVLGVVPEFLPARAPQPWDGDRAAIERRAAEEGLQELRWPSVWPPDTEFALRAATYARGIGKVVAFSLAAFRQAFAGGRDLGDRDTVLIAGAACEIHPNALLKGAMTQAVERELVAAGDRVAALGATQLPAVIAAGRVFSGDDHLEEAAAALR